MLLYVTNCVIMVLWYKLCYCVTVELCYYVTMVLWYKLCFSVTVVQTVLLCYLVEDVIILLCRSRPDDPGLVQAVAVKSGPVESSVTHLDLYKVTLERRVIITRPGLCVIKILQFCWTLCWRQSWHCPGISAQKRRRPHV